MSGGGEGWGTPQYALLVIWFSIYLLQITSTQRDARGNVIPWSSAALVQAAVYALQFFILREGGFF